MTVSRRQIAAFSGLGVAFLRYISKIYVAAHSVSAGTGPTAARETANEIVDPFLQSFTTVLDQAKESMK